MKRKLSVTGALLVAALWLPCAALAGLDEDMVAFDRAYIPALGYTSEGKLAESQQAMAALNREWTTFKARYAAMASGDGKWAADLAAIDRRIREADAIVAGGVNVVRAQEVMKGIRVTMAGMRQRNGVPYYLDVLARFHEPMEAIVLSAKDRTSATFGDAEIGKVRAMLAVAEERWAAVRAADVDPAWRLTPEQQQSLAKLVAQQSAALSALQQALEQNDAGATIKAALAIKPAFTRIYKAFGGFQAPGGQAAN